MKCLGMIGGMSYESTKVYYELINQEINRKLKKSHSAEIVMYSFDYDILEKWLEENRWDLIENRLIKETLKLKSIGAEGIILCANTMHQVANQVEESVGLPLIHIVKSTFQCVNQKKLTKVGLIGTIYTMQSDMYHSYFKSHGIEIITPSLDNQKIIHHIIYKELIIGKLSEESREKILQIIKSLEVEGIILGCTELPLLIKEEHLSIHRFDTMEIHAKSAVKFMLGDLA